MRTALALLLAALAIAAPGAAIAGGERSTHDCVRGTELSFRTADRVQLVGHRFGGLRPGSRPAVVLAHQSNGSLCEWLPTARWLAGRGIWVFAFDFRGHGSSKGRVQYGRLATDYAAAVEDGAIARREEGRARRRVARRDRRGRRRCLDHGRPSTASRRSRRRP